MRIEKETVIIERHYCDIGEWIAIHQNFDYRIKRVIGTVIKLENEYMTVWFPMEGAVLNINYEYRIEEPSSEELENFLTKIPECFGLRE